MMRAVLLAAALASTPSPIQKWPEHEFYRVERAGDDCRLRAEVSIRGLVFALVLAKGRGGPLAALLVTQRPDAPAGERLRIGVDDQTLLTLSDGGRRDSITVRYISTDSSVNDEFWRSLTHAAERGKRLWVAMGDWAEAMPAMGLEEALGDVWDCDGRV